MLLESYRLVKIGILVFNQSIRLKRCLVLGVFLQMSSQCSLRIQVLSVLSAINPRDEEVTPIFTKLSVLQYQMSKWLSTRSLGLGALLSLNLLYFWSILLLGYLRTGGYLYLSRGRLARDLVDRNPDGGRRGAPEGQPLPMRQIWLTGIPFPRISSYFGGSSLCYDHIAPLYSISELLHGTKGS